MVIADKVFVKTDEFVQIVMICITTSQNDLENSSHTWPHLLETVCVEISLCMQRC
jgi:hypothetical protein